MEKAIVQTTNLTHGWAATEWTDGSFTIDNTGERKRIDLSVESVNTLRKIFEQVKQAA